MISTKILNQYVPHDEFFVVNNNDPDLEPIKIKLPSPVDVTRIDGYGLTRHEQKWEPPEYPGRLKLLEQDVINELTRRESDNKHEKVTGQKILEGIKKKVEENSREYKEEIKWIKTQWYRVLYGYWLYINGKPTYLDGWHYAFCAFWHLEGDKLPEYRDRDRRWFHFARHCYTTTEDDKGNDTGMRTCMGFLGPKHRRAGDTYKALCIDYFIIILIKGGMCGIQSYDEGNAKTHFKEKLIPAWRKLPFFFKPMWDGTDRPMKELRFNRPSAMGPGKELETKIDFATTASRSYPDGKRYDVYHSEEDGKTLLEYVDERWDVAKQTLLVGPKIHGFSIHPTTVADMVTGGGDRFKRICDNSGYYDRIPLIGTTKSGLFRLFIPTYDGLEGFIGPYGESVIDTPTPEQAKFIKKNYGARAYHEAKRSEYLSKNTPESMDAYNTEVELYPFFYAECFRMMDGNIGFNTEAIEQAINETRRCPDSFFRADLVWIIKDVEVGIIENPLGRWEISKKLHPEYANKKTLFEDNWYPAFPDRFVHGGDPTQFITEADAKISKNPTKFSDGGGAVFWKRDYTIDPEGKDVNDWQSHNFVAAYRYRSNDDDEYAEDQLMACFYWGAMCFPEMNLRIIYKHFTKRGYAGYLLRGTDPNGTLNKLPGVTSLEASKKDLFAKTRNFIHWHGKRVRLPKLLNEWKEIKSMQQMTKYDLMASAGLALMGDESIHSKMIVNSISGGSNVSNSDTFVESNFV